MGESPVSGKMSPGNTSHGTGSQQVTPYSPERLLQSAKWTAMEGGIGPMVSCQQADFGRGWGHKSNCTTSSGGF